MTLTSIARHDVLRFVRDTETFPQESNQLVVDIRIVHLLQYFSEVQGDMYTAITCRYEMDDFV